MIFLALEGSTDHLSVGLHSPQGTHSLDCAGGPKASSSLLPAVFALLDSAGLRLCDLDALVLGQGPGAFTGLRTVCAVAQGLAWGAHKPVLLIDTLANLAETACAQHPGLHQVVATLDARMGEVYTAALQRHTKPSGHPRWTAAQALAVCAPAQVFAAPGWARVGNADAVYGDCLPPADRVLPVWPTAQALLRLAPAAWEAGLAVDPAEAAPLYVRNRVALTTSEREALAAAKALAAASTAP